MWQFVSQNALEWLPWLIGGVLMAWLFAKLYRYLFPTKVRQRLGSDRRKTPRRNDRRQLGEP